MVILECALGLDVKAAEAIEIQKKRAKSEMDQKGDGEQAGPNKEDDLFAAAFAPGESQVVSQKRESRDMNNGSYTPTSSGRCRKRDFTDLVLEDPSGLVHLNAYVNMERPKVALLLARMLRIEPAKRAECLALMRMPLLEAYLSRDAKEKASKKKPSLALKRAESDDVHINHRDAVTDNLSPAGSNDDVPILFGHSY